MIFDPIIELELLESQPEWCGISEKVKELNEKRNQFIYKLDKDPKEWIQKTIENLDKEIKFFENILLFWSSNYTKLKRISEAVEKQSSIANEGHRILSLIDDLKMAYTFEEKLDFVLCQSVIDMAKLKGGEVEKMDKALHKLRHVVKEYQTFMFASIDKETKRINE
jgi:hypothetical protein